VGKGGRADEQAAHEFREYVAARQASLFRPAVLITRSRQDAEDLLQAALTKLATRWSTIRRTGSPQPGSRPFHA
jgi:DNA-directed RNA polymerase specialized sigma24 family protein